MDQFLESLLADAFTLMKYDPNYIYNEEDDQGDV